MTRLLEPIKNRILVKELKKEESPGGIKLPGNRYSVYSEGEVINVGPGYTTSDGNKAEVQVSVGDIILFAKEGPGIIDFDFEGEDYVVLLGDDYILGKVKEIEDE